MSLQTVMMLDIRPVESNCGTAVTSTDEGGTPTLVQVAAAHYSQEALQRLAREAGVRLLRVDCFAGGDGALVRYYEQQGFTRDTAFAVPRVNDVDWPGQVLVQRL